MWCARRFQEEGCCRKPLQKTSSRWMEKEREGKHTDDKIKPFKQSWAINLILHYAHPVWTAFFQENVIIQIPLQSDTMRLHY